MTSPLLIPVRVTVLDRSVLVEIAPGAVKGVTTLIPIDALLKEHEAHAPPPNGHGPAADA